MKLTVYTLSDPTTLTPFYVGVTGQLLKKRLISHGHAKIFKQKHGKDALIEALEELDGVNLTQGRVVEFFWIQQLRSWGFILSNSQRKGSVPNSVNPMKYKSKCYS